MSKVNTMGNIEPQNRIRLLANYGNTVEVDFHIPLKRYYRSGMELVRMAHIYLDEGNDEFAYIYFIKFMTLFLDKIPSHPEYKTFPASTKQPITLKLKEVLPVTEKLKAKIMDRYQKEYEKFLATKEAEKAREFERVKESLRNKAIGNTLPLAGSLKIEIDPSLQPTSPDLSLLDKVVYPNDFPSSSNRSTKPTGLLLPDSEKKPSKPTFDRNQKPSIGETMSPESLMKGHFRTVVIPKNTMSVFLNLAKENTERNVETCGILAGKLSHSELLITHAIIPRQKGTPDSCTTMNEECIFDVQDQKNLITLGWIHTHPTQTAFLSSVDLHTHCSYQMMMPEAIAIVCAPKYNETGFFCLTPNYGLQYIAQCRLTGFHPHPKDPPLFMDAQHILLEDHLKIEVVDLRW